MTSTTTVVRGRRRARRALLCLSTILAGCAVAMPALAQSFPEFRQLDGNGVDLTTGDYVMAFKEGSIGSGDGELAIIRHNASQDRSTQWDNIALVRTVDVNGAASIQIRQEAQTADTFTGSALTPKVKNGATLTGQGSEYSYRTANGTVTVFGSPTGNGDDEKSNLCSRYTYAQEECELLPVSITTPDGRVTTLTWNFYEVITGQTSEITLRQYYWRLAKVENNRAYSVTFNYALPASDFPSLAWYRRTGAELRNELVSSSAQGTIGYTYPSNGTIDVTDMANHVWRITDSSIRRPGETAASFSVTNPSAVTSVTRDGVTTTYQRTVSGTGANATATMEVTNALNEKTTVVSNLNVGRPAMVTDPRGKTTSYEYDGSGRLTLVTAPEGNSVHYTLDGRGNATETRVVAKTGPSTGDIVTTAVYPATCANAKTCNRPTSTTDAMGQTTDYSYDPVHGGVTKVERPAPTAGAARPTTEYAYTLVAGEYQLTRASTCPTAATCAGSGNEIVQSAVYDAQGNMTSATTASGTGLVTATTAYGYTVMGDVSSVDGPIAGAQDTTTYVYDAARRPTGTTGPDPDGTGPRNRAAQRIGYDSAGRVTSRASGWAYAPVALSGGNFTAVDTAVTTWDGDRVATEGGAGRGLVTYLYNSVGRLKCSVQRMNLSSGAATACLPGPVGSYGPDRVTQPVFDAAGNLLELQTAVGTAAASTDRKMTWTDNGRVATLADGEGNLTTYVYDGFDRLQRTLYPLTAKGANASSTTDYEELGYDANGRVTSRRLRDGNVIAYGWDAAGRLLHKSPQGARGVAYGWDYADRLTVAAYDSLGGADRVTMVYDPLSRVTSETTSMSYPGGIGSVSRQMGYEYDLSGNVKKVTHPGGTVSFNLGYDNAYAQVSATWTAPVVGTVPFFGVGYDDAGRRTATNRASSLTTYGYDGASRLNGLGQAFAYGVGDDTTALTYNPASQIASRTSSNDAFAYAGHTNGSVAEVPGGLNRVVSQGSTTIGYDANGNVTNDGTASYDYDRENRLVYSSIYGGTTLIYDPLGRLWSLASPVWGKTQFVYDRGQVAIEYDGGTGDVRRRYFWGPGVDEPVLQDEDGAMNCSGTKFLHGDERGSIVGVADCNGNRTNANTYDDYGNGAAGNWGRYQYTGQAWLQELGLYNYKNRMYSARLGRFMQTDPIGYDAGMNLYGYVGGDPVNFTDPLGLAGCTFANDGSVHVCGEQNKPEPVVRVVNSGPSGPAVGGRRGSKPLAPTQQNDVLNHDIGEDIEVWAKRVPKPVQDFISDWIIDYDCGFINSASCGASDYVSAGLLLSGSGLIGNVAVEGPKAALLKYGKGRAGQIRFFEDRLKIRLDINKPYTHFNIEGRVFGIKFNFHIPKR